MHARFGTVVLAVLVWAVAGAAASFGATDPVRQTLLEVIGVAAALVGIAGARSLPAPPPGEVLGE